MNTMCFNTKYIFLHVGLVLTLHKILFVLNKTGIYTFFLGKVGRLNNVLQSNGWSLQKHLCSMEICY